jgi:hypothetical protein
MKIATATVALAVCGLACAAPDAAVHASGPPVAGEAAKAMARPAATAPVTVDALLRREPGDGSVLVLVSVVRAHPLGPRVEPFLLAWPGWGATLASIAPHPLDDLEWIAVVGPRDPARERMMTRTAAAADDVIDSRLRERSDGTLRVVVRGPAHAVVALRPDDAPAVVPALPTARVLEPQADADEALHVDFPDPHRMLSPVPAEVRRLVLRAYSRPGGGGEAFADLVCDDDATAARVADELRTRADQVNNLAVRLLTRDLLGGLVVTVEGPVAKLRLPATREQLESLATLAAAVLPPDARGAFHGRQAVPP